MKYFSEENWADSEGDFRWVKATVHALLAVLVVVVVFGSFGTIKAGEVGVRTTLGAVSGTMQPGLYLKLPFVQKVHKINVKTLTINYDKGGDNGDEKPTGDNLFGASKDLQDVAIGIVVNYHIKAEKAKEIFTQYQSTENFEHNVVEPIVRETVKSTSAQYTAEELVTKRSDFSDKVNASLISRLQEKDVVMEKFSVTNFEFSAAFTQAIESKVTAVQNAEAAKNKLEQIKFEAQQTIETARATAEAQRISSAALAAQGGQDYVQLKAIEKWDGKLPTQLVPGSAVPFVQLNR